MRVITGTARGRRLREPEGLDIRPTAARVKEGVFSALQFDIEGRRVLDLFAGTGQLGIECLSRGAAFAVFVDGNPRALETVRANLKATGLADRAAVRAGDALTWLEGTRERFDLIFLDPPYAGDLLAQALDRLAAFDILKPHGIIVAEHPAGKALPEPRFRCRRTYRYGKTAVSLYCREMEDKDEHP